MEEIVELNLSDSSEREEEVNEKDASILETLVNACNTVIGKGNNLEETVSLLKKELNLKEKTIRSLQTKNSELEMRIHLLESDKAIMMIDAESNKVQMARYKQTIVKLNKVVKLIEPRKDVPEQGEPFETALADTNEVRKKEEPIRSNAKKRKKCKFQDKGFCKEKSQCPHFLINL